MTGFPQLRHDPLTDRLVLLAPGRSRRPSSVDPPAPTREGAGHTGPAPPCPFCPGNEAATPPEVMRTGAGAPDSPGWNVRVVPNLYPFVGGPDAEPGATGTHEVIVLSPDHALAFEALPVPLAVEMLTVLRERARDLAEHAHVQPLLNQGRAAGASIAHPHAQLVAVDFVPAAVTSAVERFRAAGTDLVIADVEAAEEHELVVTSERTVRAWCSRAAASPFEVRVSPIDAGPDFAGARDGQVNDVAVVLRSVLASLVDILERPDYNVVFHTAARDAAHHWWLEIVPRISVAAGFELATGVSVNVVDPATATIALRERLGSA
jgi:UDPglucose--hexose-1-phosphate uridylyltransferase